MTKITDNLRIIHNNPFIMAPLFTNFFYSLTEAENNYLFCYLLLPLVLKKDRRNFILNSKSNSSIHTFKKNQSRLVGLSDDVQYYKELTHNTMQHTIDNNWLVINDNLSVRVKENPQNIQRNLTSSYNASEKVSNILGDLDVLTVYRLLGIKSV